MQLCCGPSQCIATVAADCRLSWRPLHGCRPVHAGKSMQHTRTPDPIRRPDSHAFHYPECSIPGGPVSGVYSTRFAPPLPLHSSTVVALGNGAVPQPADNSPGNPAKGSEALEGHTGTGSERPRSLGSFGRRPSRVTWLFRRKPAMPSSHACGSSHPLMETGLQSCRGFPGADWTLALLHVLLLYGWTPLLSCDRPLRARVGCQYMKRFQRVGSGRHVAGCSCLRRCRADASGKHFRH
jgi:hypothetical protein